MNLKTANQSSCMTLWPITLHHHTEFGNRGSAAEEISSRWTFTGILNIPCDFDFDHNSAIQSFHKTIQLMIMCHQTKLSSKRISSSDDTLKSHILIWSFTVTLTLKTANQSFWKVIWLIMMHHHTKFGGKGSVITTKRLRYSEDIIWTNINWHFKILLWPWPCIQQSSFCKEHFGLW